MELDELKLLLNSKREIPAPEKSVAEIRALLGKKTQSVLGKLSRSLRIELFATILFAILLFFTAWYAPFESLRIYSLIFGLLCLLFFPVILVLLKKVTALTLSSLPVKSNLQQLHEVLRQFVRLYFQLTMALIPVATLLAGWLGYHDQLIYQHATGSEVAQNPEAIKYIVLLGIYLVAFTTAMYFFTKWYLKKLYGDYLTQLQGLIKELED
ncbi:MAG TPA: hypothetical protein PKM63_22480 [Panacibacter sp.]|nr:hypothetical protein [Panacibacter sp.]HNP47081.1 hypothetical protein [Panacibacter sp.]